MFIWFHFSRISPASSVGCVFCQDLIRESTTSALLPRLCLLRVFDPGLPWRSSQTVGLPAFSCWKGLSSLSCRKPAGNPSEATFSLVSWKNSSELPHISSQRPHPSRMEPQPPTESIVSLTPLIRLPSFLSCLIPLLLPLASQTTSQRKYLHANHCLKIFFHKINYIGGHPNEDSEITFSFCMKSRKDKLIETESRQVVAQD